MEELKTYRDTLEGINNINQLVNKGSKPGWDREDWLDGALALTTGGLFGSGSYKFQGYSNDNLAQYKKNIDEYIEMQEKLLAEQEKFFENATLESFAGISVIAESELKKQYEDMYKDLGLDPRKYQADIDEMVKANQVLVQSTDELRENFVSLVSQGENIGDAFLSSMSTYFSMMLSNASSVIYDALFSDFDRIANDYFLSFSNMLVNTKKQGLNVFEEIDKFLFSSETDEFINHLVNMSKLEQDIDKFTKQLRQQLLNAGLSESEVDKLGIIDSARRQILELEETLKSSLSNAMSSALDTGDLEGFKSSLGRSIYESAKESLIKAFSESEIYNKMFQSWFDTKDIEFSGNVEQDLSLMNKLLEDLNTELIKNDMDFQSDSGRSEENMSGTYYHPTLESNSSVSNKNYYFDFKNAHIYNEDEFTEKVKDIFREKGV